MAARKPLMTPEQQKNFKEAVEKKLINPLPYDQYCKLTPEEAEKMLKEVNMGTQAPAKAAPTERPGANEPATKFQIKAIDDAVKAGIIFPVGKLGDNSFKLDTLTFDRSGKLQFVVSGL